MDSIAGKPNESSPDSGRQKPTGLTPHKIAALVPMPRLLRALRLPTDEATHFSPCPFCGCQRKDVFRWDLGGRWACSACGRRGDKIDLVRQVGGGGFYNALRFLCRLAGVAVPPRRKRRSMVTPL